MRLPWLCGYLACVCKKIGVEFVNSDALNKKNSNSCRMWQ